MKSFSTNAKTPTQIIEYAAYRYVKSFDMSFTNLYLEFFQFLLHILYPVRGYEKRDVKECECDCSNPQRLAHGGLQCPLRGGYHRGVGLLPDAVRSEAEGYADESDDAEDRAHLRLLFLCLGIGTEGEIGYENQPQY